MQAPQRMQRSISAKSLPSIFRAAVVEQDDVIFVGPVGVTGAARSRRERRIDRHVLSGRRAGQHAQQCSRVLQRRHQFLDRGEDDVDLGKLCDRSPLPSLVTMIERLPVSATRKLAPVMPTSAARNFSRRILRASARSSTGSLRSRSGGRPYGRGGSLRRPGPWSTMDPPER